MSDEIELLLPAIVPLSVLFGVVIGSFLNVVIYRVPAGKSIVKPGSACPKCETPIKGRDNIPLLSWLLLRGKCRTCAEPISARYPAVEAATGLLFGAVTWWSLLNAPEFTPLFLTLTGVGVALFMIDLDTKRLPDQIVLPLFAVVPVLLAVGCFLTDDWPLARIGTVTAIWFFTFAIPWFVTAGRGMGFGDVKLAPLLGASLAVLGYGPGLVGIFAGFALGTVVGIGLIAFKDAGRKTKVPYGPFMLAGALVGLLAGQAIWEWYLTTMGL